MGAWAVIGTPVRRAWASAFGRGAARQVRQTAASSRGAAALEFALTAPILAFIFMEIVGYGLAMYTVMEEQAVADAGAIWAVANSSAFQNSPTNNSALSTAATAASSNSAIYTVTSAQVYGCPSATSPYITVEPNASQSCGSGQGTARTYAQIGVSVNSNYKNLLGVGPTYSSMPALTVYVRVK